jgi:hypothetical protein
MAPPLPVRSNAIPAMPHQLVGAVQCPERKGFVSMLHRTRLATTLAAT